VDIIRRYYRSCRLSS